MKKFQFKKEQYLCPTSWDEITLKKQLQVSRDAEEFTNDVTKRIAIISGYAGIPVDVIKKSTPEEVGRLFKHLKFISEDIPSEQINKFEFNGKTYYVGQNLMEQEFQDFVSVESAIHNAEGQIWEALPYLMAVMCKQKKEDGSMESLDDYNVEARAKEFEDIPITIANGLSVFFWNLEKTSTTLSVLSSHPEKVIQMKVEEVENTLTTRVGMGLLSRLQIFALRIYLKFLKRNAAKFFHSTPPKSSTPKWKMMLMKLSPRGKKHTDTKKTPTE